MFSVPCLWSWSLKPQLECSKLHYTDQPRKAILGPGTPRIWESLITLGKPISLQTASSNILENFEFLSYRILALTFLAFSLLQWDLCICTPSVQPLIIAICQAVRRSPQLNHVFIRLWLPMGSSEASNLTCPESLSCAVPTLTGVFVTGQARRPPG